MIVTLTLNPSLDYVMQVSDYQDNRVNRADRIALTPGGKGINVSIMLKNLGFDTKMLGFTAGFTGEEICRQLKELGVSPSFITLPSGSSRINVKLKTGHETEINAAGPEIPPSALEELFLQLETLAAGDFLVLAGSVPRNLSDDFYCQILDRLAGRGISAVVDAEGALLEKTLAYQPFLIKPNHHELGSLFGAEIVNQAMAADYAKRLQSWGARNVLVSMGAQGAVLVCETGEILCASPICGTLINSTGAGDSMVAGFLAGFLQSSSFYTALLYGCCAGSATAFSQGLASAETVQALIQQVSATEFIRTVEA